MSCSRPATRPPPRTARTEAHLFRPAGPRRLALRVPLVWGVVGLWANVLSSHGVSSQPTRVPPFLPPLHGVL